MGIVVPFEGGAVGDYNARCVDLWKKVSNEFLGHARQVLSKYLAIVNYPVSLGPRSEFLRVNMFPIVVELSFGHAALPPEIIEDLVMFQWFHGFCCCVSGGC